MIASVDLLSSLALIKFTDAQDFANLMPRPGWLV